MNNKRKLVAALACRAASARLYAKPLQNLDKDTMVIEHLLSSMKDRHPAINQIVLGISEGIENQPFIQLAQSSKIPHIIGDQKDVLSRLIACGKLEDATDVFRVTSECPFIAWEYFDDVWNEHIKNDNDVTVLDHVPHGMHFEIYKISALEKSHAKGNDSERSEYCSLYVRNNINEFKVAVIKPAQKYRRPDIRVTIDYPEDLIVCRKIYDEYKNKKIELNCEGIVSFLDHNSDLKNLNGVYASDVFLWS